MAEITWTDEAQRWLEDIFEYIAADNPELRERLCRCATRNRTGAASSSIPTQRLDKQRAGSEAMVRHVHRRGFVATVCYRLENRASTSFAGEGG